MELDRIPKPGEIYNHFKDKPYQIITVAMNAETNEYMVVYQALYGDFKTYVRALTSFLSEVDHAKYPDIMQKYRFELQSTNQVVFTKVENAEEEVTDKRQEILTEESVIRVSKAEGETSGATPKADEIRVDSKDSVQEEQLIEDTVINPVLLQFLDADSYYKKLEVITTNRKHMTDRLINDIAVSLDCTVDEGPLDQRIQSLLFCLQSLCRFENKRLR